MTEYRFAATQDLPKVIDFIDLVFSQSARPHDFAELIPKVYGDGNDYSHIHAIALEEGEIRGCVAVLPFDMTIAGHTLHAGYLGSVSVHRLSRGAGHMKKLMQMQIDKAKADGLDMLVLGGQRQRYGYFGFSPIGGSYRYTVTHANVRHALKDTDISAFSFEPLEQNENSQYAFDLYQQQPVCGSRTAERFAVIARTFHMHGWLVRHNGASAGYLISTNDHSEIHELVMADPAQVPAVLKAWMAVYGVRHLNITAAPHNTALNRTLSAFAEGYSLGQDSYVLCLNHARTAAAWAALKSSISAISDGSIRIGVNHQTLAFEASEGVLKVAETHLPAEVQLTPAEADQLLFGFNRFYAPELNAPVPADWFPLPLNIPTADTF